MPVRFEDIDRNEHKASGLKPRDEKEQHKISVLLTELKTMAQMQPQMDHSPLPEGHRSSIERSFHQRPPRVQGYYEP